MNILRGRRYLEARTPCGCLVRLYWGEQPNVGEGTRYCRKHHRRFHYRVRRIELTHGPLMHDLSGSTTPGFLITWTPWDRWKAEQKALAHGPRGDKADWMEVDGVRKNREELDHEIEELER